MIPLGSLNTKKALLPIWTKPGQIAVMEAGEVSRVRTQYYQTQFEG